ncbi:hypothetical protein [Cedecea sp. FDAARGOS_727]|uniref:hypothetical protein n=1 Tax=Cedecea TaxID=158483 RepID=UPI00143EA10C|nr:hypothetical protein [Cedecea sp. FDAARGOS_727]QIX97218.1 hypothetical protein FOC35_16645 [Cedecea sp. FDAARGOS_727]
MLQNDKVRADILRSSYPRLESENNTRYLRRLVLLSNDVPAIAIVCRRSRKYVAELRYLVEKINYAQMENLWQTFPRSNHEGDSEYARRLLMVSKDLESIAFLSGVTMGTVYRLRRTIIAELEGRAANISNTVPKLSHENAQEYACRLIPLSEDTEAISAASGMSLGHVQLLKRRATENM